MGDRVAIVQNFMASSNLPLRNVEQKHNINANERSSSFTFASASAKQRCGFVLLSVILIFLALVTGSLVQPMFQYTVRKEDASVHIDKVTEMPPVTICPKNDGYDDYLKWHGLNTRGAPLYELLSVALNNSNREQFLAEWDSNNVTLQTAVYYFRKMFRWQHSIYDRRMDIKSEREKALKNDHQWIAAEMLEKFIIEKKISQKELFVRLGKELNKVYQIVVHFQHFVDNQTKREYITYPNGHPLTWVGENIICFLIKLPYKINDPGDTLTIYLDTLYSYGTEAGGLRPAKKPTPVHISLDGKTKLRSAEDSKFDLRTSRWYDVSTKMNGMFEITDDCSTTKSKLWCQAECRQKLIQEKCNCAPLDFDIEFQRKHDERLNDGFETCWASKHFGLCTPYKGTEDRRCIVKECLSDCKVKSMDVELKNTIVLKPKDNPNLWVDYIKFTLSVGKFHYPTFKQRNMMENFVTDVGRLLAVAFFFSFVKVGEYFIRKVLHNDNIS